jgi:hypothetical protein
MKIEFDAGNETELSAVFVAIAVLRGGDMSLPLLGDESAFGPAEPPAPPVAAVPPAPPVAAAPPPPVAVPPAPPVAAVPPAPPAAPAAPAVPAAPAAPAAAAPAGVDVDKAGLPYDARIHSKPPSKKKDGYWRQKRGVDEATVASVTAELQQAMAAPPAGPVPPPMFAESAPGVPVPLPPAAAEPAADAATVFGAAGAGNASEPPAPPVAAVPPAPPAAPVVPAAPVDPLAAAIADGWQPHPSSEGFYYREQECVATADLVTRYSAPVVPPAGEITFADLMRKITALQTAGTLTVEGTTQIAQSLGITSVRDLMHRPDLIPAFDAALPVVA